MRPIRGCGLYAGKYGKSNLILGCHLYKKLFLVWEMKNKADKNAEHKQNIKVACLKQGIEMNRFCLKKGQGLKASAAHPHPNFP